MRVVTTDNYKNYREDILSALRNTTAKQYKFKPAFRLTFDRVTICAKIDSDRPTVELSLDEECNKTYMEEWVTGIGGIVKKDIKHNNLDIYSEISFNGDYKALLRTVSDEELEQFSENKLLTDNIIYTGDVNFIIVKIISGKDTSYSSRPIIINDNPEPVVEIDSEDDPEENYEEVQPVISYSLFDF